MKPVVKKAEPTKFKVIGTDYEVESVQELGKLLEKQWKKPKERTLDEIEAEFNATYEKLRKQHPTAVKVIFRDGEKGYDRKNPEKVYAGGRDAYWSSHGPDSLFNERSENRGKSETHEIFMRHRSPLMKVDLETIAPTSRVLTAKLVITRASKEYPKEHDPFARPTMWVAEPCGQAWDEYEVNAFQYRKNDFWREIGGRYYRSEGPDFLPLYVAHGPGQGMVNEWDFTIATRLWVASQFPNFGFMLHGDSRDWLVSAWTREAKEIRNRPALYVIYVP